MAQRVDAHTQERINKLEETGRRVLDNIGSYSSFSYEERKNNKDLILMKSNFQLMYKSLVVGQPPPMKDAIDHTPVFHQAIQALLTKKVFKITEDRSGKTLDFNDRPPAAPSASAAPASEGGRKRRKTRKTRRRKSHRRY
jgi:hypothetical protein